jgi:hypothetical protein
MEAVWWCYRTRDVVLALTWSSSAVPVRELARHRRRGILQRERRLL